MSPSGVSTSLDTAVVIVVKDQERSAAFYEKAFGLGDPVRTRACETPTSGFRGCTLSLTVAQPGTVDLQPQPPAAATPSAIVYLGDKPRQKAITLDLRLPGGT